MKRKLLFTFIVTLLVTSINAQDYCLHFNGDANRVRYDTDATLDILNGATDYTIEAWFYPTDNQIHNRVIVKRWNQFAITMYQDANKRVYFTHYANDGATRTYVNSIFNVVVLNQWNHVAVINNSTDNTLKIFMNGVDVTADSSGTATTHTALTLDPAPGTGANFYVGYGGSGTTPFAFVDKVRVKKTAEDIANLHTSDVTVPSYTTDADTAVLLNFDEGSGATTANEASSSMANLQCAGGCADLPDWHLVNATMAVDNLNKITFSVYPNPVKGNMLTVQTTENEIVQTVEITDVLGKVVFLRTYSDNNTKIQINVNALKKGVYLMKIKTDYGVGTHKLMIN